MSKSKVRPWFFAFVIAGAFTAQDKPDFSGHWVLEEPAAPPATIAHELVVSRWVEWSPLSPVNGQSFPSEFIAIEQRHAGGKVQVNRYGSGISGGVTPGVPAGPNSRHWTFSTRWSGDQFVIETGSYTGPSYEPTSYAEHSEAWSFDEQGRLLIEVMDRSSETSPTKSKLIYKQRQ